jgi:hypothetical protein
LYSNKKKTKVTVTCNDDASNDEKHIRSVLQQLLSRWMDLATKNHPGGIYNWNDDVVVQQHNGVDAAITAAAARRKVPPSQPPLPPPSIHTPSTTQADDLQLLERCLSWRQLYFALEHRKIIIQATQGKRMREIRDNVRCTSALIVMIVAVSFIHLFF